MSEYIKREDALNRAITVRHFDGKLGGVCDHQYVRVVDINAIPAADVEPVVRGEWVQKTITERSELFEEEFEIPVIVCSVCDTIVSFPSSYCPECGAHMERSGSGE